VLNVPYYIGLILLPVRNAEYAGEKDIPKGKG
jgi:hypothetical protein